MLEQLEVKDPIVEYDESGNPDILEKKKSLNNLYFDRQNREVGGLCGSCIRFQDCTYPKTARGAIFCDEYSR